MNFNFYSAYYDLLNQEKQYAKESEYLENLLLSYCPGQNLDILELGCGSGAHAEYLVKSPIVNFIQGIELSREMVNAAKDKSIKSFDVIQGDIVELSKVALYKSFDAAISLFHVMSYLTTNEEIISCLKGTNRLLKTGGIFIFDVWYTPAVYFQKPETRIRKVENHKYEVTRISQSTIYEERNVVDVNFEIYVKDKNSNKIEVFNEIHPMRHFSTSEIQLISELTGFELLDSHGFQTMIRPTVNTWGVIYIV